jgi:hypothetical protein
MNSIICDAVHEHRLLRLNYHWGYRIVEPHAYGLNDNGHELLRVFQVSGASESGAHHGWKLLRVDEIHQLEILEEKFAGSRPDYRRSDKAMDQRIYCQL